MYRRYELPAEQNKPFLYVAGKVAGMAENPPGLGDIATFRIGGLATFDLLVEAVGDGTVQGEVVDFQGYFTEAFPRTFELGDLLGVDTAAVFLLRRAE